MSIDKRGIKKMMRDLQKEFDRNGPVRVRVETESADMGGDLSESAVSMLIDSWKFSDAATMSLDTAAILLMDWLLTKNTRSTYLDVEAFARQFNLPDGRGDALIEYVENKGWADVIHSFGGSSARINARGTAFIEDIRRCRADRALRTADLQRQMIRWLHEEEESGESPADWEDFLSLNPSHLLGEPFRADEVERQAKYLEDRGLIGSLHIEEATPGWVRPTLTSEGQDCVTRSRGVVASFMSQRGATSGGNYYGPVIFGNADGAQLAWGNTNVQQGMTKTEQIAPGFEQLATAVADVLRILPGLGMDDEVLDDTESVANEILAEVVNDEPNPSKLRRACAALKGLLLPIATQAGSGAAEGAHELARQAMESIGNAGF